MTSEDGRRLRRWRVAMLVVCVPVSLFFGLMLVGIAITVGDPDAWEPGDVVTVPALTILSGVVAVGTGVSAHRLGSRIDVLAGTTAWLPAADRPRGKAQRSRRIVSPAWIRGLRNRAARAMLICFACFLGFAASVWWGRELDNSAAQLLRDGTRVPGYVTAAWTSRSSSFLNVSYLVGGVAEDYTFRRDSDRSYVAGQPVTVVYDPADPTRIRTVEEKNVSEGALSGAMVTLFASLAAFTWSVIVAAGWIGRHRRTRITGWCEVSAVQAERLQSRSRLQLVLRNTDGTRILVRPTAASLYAAGQATGGRPVTAFVSGTGRAMTVLVPREGARPRLIAVKAQGRRT